MESIAINDATLSEGRNLPSSASGRKRLGSGIYLAFLLIVFGGSLNKMYAQTRPGLFFREDWKEIEAALPVTQEHVAHPDLTLSLYGAGLDGIKKSNHPHIPNDPYYIWSGECSGNWAVSLKHQQHLVDLSGEAEIHWRSKQSGFRQLRLFVKLSDGTALISDQYDGASEDWRTKVFKMADIRWRELDLERVVEGNWVERPDLSAVEEIGFTDLMAGGKTPASSRLDWIAVFGKPVEK